MNDTRTLVPVEEEILRELRAHVAQRTTAVRRRRRVVQGVGVAAAAALVVGGSFLLPRGTSPLAPAPATAADVLNTAAHAAADAPNADGNYWRVEVRSTGADDDGGGKLHNVFHDDRTEWTAKDGQRWNLYVGNADWDAGVVNPGFDKGFVLYSQSVSYQQLNDLPSDPTALREAVSEFAEGETGIEPALIALLADVPVAPAVRAAAFRALADEPDVKNLGKATDRMGRSGTKLEFAVNGDHQTVIIDPEAGTLLQYDHDSSGGGGGDIANDTYVGAGWTDTPPSS